MHIVVSRAHIRGVGIRHPPLFGSHNDAVGRHQVVASRLQGADTLGEDEGFVGEVLRHVLHPLMVVVEAHEVDGTALKEVVVGVGLVTASGNRTRGIVALDDVGQMLREQRLYRQLAILGQRRGVVTCIENEVGLFERQRVSLSRRPLLQVMPGTSPLSSKDIKILQQQHPFKVNKIKIVDNSQVIHNGVKKGISLNTTKPFLFPSPESDG